MDDAGHGNVIQEHTSGDLASDLSAALAKPARRALAADGYVRLEQLTTVSEDELLKLHGMGPQAIDLLRSARQVRGRSFADEGGGHVCAA